MSAPHQYPLPLPPRRAPAAEMPANARARLVAAYRYGPKPGSVEHLRETLADRVEQLNATTCPAERVTLHGEVSNLRQKLAQMEVGHE
jgi:hypothetical protein